MKKSIWAWFGRRRGSKGFVMIGTSVSVFFLIAALLAGAQSRGGIIDLLSGRFWLTNDKTGSVMLANGSSAKLDLRMTIKGAQGDALEVIRVGNQSLLLDRTSGDVSRLDVANLTVADAHNLPNAPNVSLVAVGDKLVVVDPKGTVQVEDPANLRTLSTLQLGQRLTRGVLAPNGTVWVGEPTAGVVVPLTTTTDGQLRPGKPVNVGPDDKMELALVNDKPTVVAATRKAVITIDGSSASAAVPFPMGSGDTVAVPAKVIGPLFPISINTAGELVLVDGTAAQPVDLGLQGKELGGPVPFGGRVYVPDFADGQVVVVDATGNHSIVPGVTITGGGSFSVTVDGGRLWVDDPNGSQAFVLGQGETSFRQIDKALPNVPSNDQPPPPTIKPPVLPTLPPPVVFHPRPTAPPGGAPAPPRVAPTTIPPSAPGAPTNVGAVGGDASAIVSWGPATANGAAIQEYDISWTVSGTGGSPGQTIVPAASLQTTVSALTNGAAYIFTVVAKNSVGVGPGAVSPPVTPSSNVPSAPGAAAATANADGSVDVTWQAANGQGHVIQGYDVTANSSGSGGGQSTVNVASKITGTSAHVASGSGLSLGTSYTFTVVATNDVNNASSPSQPSNAVTPYMPAAAPGNPTAKLNGTNIDVSWQAPNLNGGTLSSYSVTGDNGLSPQTTSGTTATFGSLTPGTSYTFTIAATTTANGKSVTGPKATTAPTTYGIAPSVSNLSANLSGDRQISVSFNVDAHNSGGVTCHVIFNGNLAWQGGCGNPATPTIGGLSYSTDYDIYATADNAYGASGATNHASVRTNNPPPTVGVSKGAPGTSKIGTCNNPGCNWVHVALRNFSPNTGYNVACSDSGGNFWNYKVTTDGSGASDSESGGCLYGFKGATVTVTAGGVSGSVVW